MWNTFYLICNSFHAKVNFQGSLYFIEEIILKKLDPISIVIWNVPKNLVETTSAAAIGIQIS